MKLGSGSSMGRRIAIAVALVCSALIALPANADVGVRCDYCSAEVAKEAALSEGILGKFYVFSVPEGSVRAFIVEQAGGGHAARPAQVPEDVRLAVTGLKEVFDNSGGSMKGTLDVYAADFSVPGAASANAVTFLGNSNLRAMMGDHLAQGAYSGPGMTTSVRALIQTSTHVLRLASTTEFTITVRFPDGSSVVYDVKPGRSVADYVEGSARTANGQQIPETNSAAYAGTWIGPAGDLDLVLEQLRQLAIPVAFGEGAAHPAPSATIAIVCWYVDGSLTCTSDKVQE